MATTQWFTCTVAMIGTSSGSLADPPPRVYLQLNEPNGTFSADQQFFASIAIQDEMLAVGLAALTTRRNVQAQIDWPLQDSGMPQCYSLYMLAS